MQGAGQDHARLIRLLAMDQTDDPVDAEHCRAMFGDVRWWKSGVDILAQAPAYQR